MEKQSIFDNVVGEPESFFMTRENGMRFLIAAVFSVALSVSSGAFAQGTQPEGAQPTPVSEYSYAEHGRYHPAHPVSDLVAAVHALAARPGVPGCRQI